MTTFTNHNTFLVAFFFAFYWHIEKTFPLINTLNSSISTFGAEYVEKNVLSSSFSNGKTNNLLTCESIKRLKLLVLV